MSEETGHNAEQTPKNTPANYTPGEPPPLSREITELLDYAEEHRAGYMRRYRTRQNITITVMVICALIAGGLFGWFFLMEAQLLTAIGLMIPCIIPPVLSAIWQNGPLTAYAHYYKNDILPKLARSLGGFKYSPKRGISRKMLDKTAITPHFTHYEAEDCFSGKYNDAKIIFSEARLYQDSKHPAFDGLFMMIELPKSLSFKGLGILTADETLAQRAGQKLNRVDLSSNNYALNFHALSNDNSNAHILSNPALIKEFHEMVALFDHAPCSISLFGHRYVFIMVPYAVNMFEASDIRYPIANRGSISRCIKEIEQIQSIIDIIGSLQNKNS